MLSATMSAHAYPRLDILSDDSDSDAESDRYTEMSLDGSVASTKTSLDESMRSASPAPSVFSFTSSLRAQAYRQEYGRGLNNYSEVYRLPADEEELDRLDKQHIMFCKVMGKYPPPLPQIMADDGFEVKAILDLGCGSGSWIMDVAREFPHCSAVAVDLVPMQSLSEVDDINLGLEHFYGDFQRRALPAHFVGRLDKQPLLPPAGTFHPPWTPLFMSYVHRAVKDRGGDAEASTHMYEWVSTHPAFEDVVYRPFWIPCSPWMSGNDPVTKFWNEVGATMRDDVQAFFRSSRPLLLGHGLGEEFVDTMTRNACEELDDAVTPVYVLIDNVYARKRH
ncbi:hypothetical protein JVT61DRAFT_5164 [Boletus reticuloceps]|uniref:S-adenosyl-L-methionine-dependent methyltransferase n=1 Tax=Boletus reticuloceps TaxID=495285 RepID=A0A8I3AFS6_9AGAM|nr:hypothetical protein JVT61DRAFT_5164 [Boletus reticuloceps]